MTSGTFRDGMGYLGQLLSASMNTTASCASNPARRFRLPLSVLVLGLAIGLCGCKKSADNASAGNDATVVVIPNTDLKPDGTISDEGLQKVQAKANANNLTVVFVRSPISDAGLNQLASFPKLRRVEASGSGLSDQGIAKLKQTIPEVEVIR